MTSVPPIAKYFSGSFLNMLDEYNFINDNIFDEYFGFCEDDAEIFLKQKTANSVSNMETLFAA